MFRTLRSKLIFSYIAVAALSLLLALVVTLTLAGDYARKNGFRTLREKEALAIPYVQSILVENRKVLPRQLPRVQDAIKKAGLRVLLVDADTRVIVDDAPVNYNATGQTFHFNDTDLPLFQLLKTKGVEGTFKLPGEGTTFQYVAERPARIMAARIIPAIGAGAQDQTGNNPAAEQSQLIPYIVVLAQPQPGLATFATDLSSYVLEAVAVALLASLILGFVLARSISRPVTRLAAAAGAVAQGDYTQRIAVEGQDELATLTDEFNKMASEVGRAHQMQRDFTANVSHDLKTPLTSIQGFSQAIMDGAIRDETGYREAAAVINLEAQRMARLVSQLLSLSQLQNGLSALDMRPVELGAIFSQMILAMQPQAQEAGVLLGMKVDSAAQGRMVLADVDRLKQAFGNLLDNAIKHTPGGGTVTLEMSGKPSSLEICVRDTGEGIPPEDLPRIMERFYQVDKARSSVGGRSLGLGLAIAREVVLAHHGQIDIGSAPGTGTIVRVELPATAGAEHEQKARKLLPLSRAPRAHTSEPANGHADPKKGADSASPAAVGSNGKLPHHD